MKKQKYIYNFFILSFYLTSGRTVCNVCISSFTFVPAFQIQDCNIGQIFSISSILHAVVLVSPQTGPHIPKEAFCSMLCHNQVLHHLCVSNCSDWITDKELLPVIGQNQHLLRVDLRGCVHLSRHALVAVSLSCPRLQHLSLAHCEWVDSLALRSLADHCSDLRSLDVTACRQLKDDAVCYLAGKCPALRSLSVAVNANITDTAVEEVAKKCRELERLDLTGCLRVRNEAIRCAVFVLKLKSD